jgi:site-specific DNA-methyltransferase (adenine-specific)
MSLPTPYYDQDGITIYHGDCREVLPEMEAVDLVLADPPYKGVLDEAWDNQWGRDSEFLGWLRGIVKQMDERLRDNGTLYVFASPRLAGCVEGVVSERLRVIASCVWDKGQQRLGAAGSGIDVTALRTFWASDTERCIVAEKCPARFEEADAAAREASGYWTACQQTKRTIFGDYLNAEFRRAGVTRKQIAALFPSRTGRLTGCVSNWLHGHNCPTPEQYKAMRQFLNRNSEKIYLRQNYEYLRQNYEDLRQNYEDLRRPFQANPAGQWGSVWRWPVPKTDRKHPAQKPLGMMRELVSISSRPDAVILDPFMGSGTTLRAAKDLGRRAIGIEIEEKYCEIAANRLAQGVLPFGE